MTIVVKTYGGLGNQLFQYAFARATSSHLKTKFLLDIDTSVIHEGLRVHKFSLSHFNTYLPQARWFNLFGFVLLKRQKKIFNFVYNHLRWKQKILPFYYPEYVFTFDRNVFSVPTNTYFDGFWQTEKYFKNIEKEIRQELTLNKPLSPYSKDMLNKINSVNAVSLHVRRTDYVYHNESNSFHGICELDYYKDAINHIVKNVPAPHFFLFSDDLLWVKENFEFLKHPFTLIENGADKNYEDITLMSMCKHHIIANSSFSWWGAWLNPSKEKIVIAPKRWFAGAPKNDTKDLLPDDWITI